MRDVGPVVAVSIELDLSGDDLARLAGLAGDPAEYWDARRKMSWT